jgi:hypothetical protein
VSSPLAIAGVTAVLQNLLDNGLVEANVSGSTGTKVTVSALPPDMIKLEGPNAETQLNVFLHQVTPNPGWVNVALPSRDERGARLTNPPLALDLHYLLTAYGNEELHAEILLGYAMHLLHETPVLDRQAIRDALSGNVVDTSLLPPAFQSLNASDLADQVEQLRITPTLMSTEEMSRLWSALQAHYRPTAAYQISVVLIQSTRATKSALPVLTRGPRDPVTQRERGVVVEPSMVPPFPTVSAVEPPQRQVAAQPGDTVTLRGHHLDGSNIVVAFEHPRADRQEVAVGSSTDPGRLAVALPNAPALWPAGLWTVTMAVQRPGETELRTTNAMPMLLAPRLDLTPGQTTVTREAATGAVTVHLAFAPQVKPGQTVRLNVAGRESAPAPFTAPTGTLDFVFADLPAGAQWIRLRIDGADSVLVDRTTVPPRFDTSQRVTVPA